MHLIFDANLPHNLAKGIALLEGGNKKSPFPAKVGHVYDFMPHDATDEEIIQKAAIENWIIITQDVQFGRIQHEYTLVKEHKVSVIYFKPPEKGFSYWDLVKSFIEKWEDLKKTISDIKTPCALLIEKSGGIKSVFIEPVA